MTADEVASPCTGVCRLDQGGETCIGCRRTLDEIAGWAQFSPAQKRQVLQAIGTRKVEQARAGQADY